MHSSDFGQTLINVLHTDYNSSSKVYISAFILIRGGTVFSLLFDLK